ncbi:MAG: electron transport complex subunit RsxB [Hydrogenophaga sp.]
MKELAQLIDAALPQTQCTRCGYPDCARYAQAIASGEAGINQCPPGGQEGIDRLAAITGQPVRALDTRFGIEGPLTVAVIDEDWCIGCTLCIKACPTDAILGSNKHMHTVIEPYCTGCELCIPVCPIDCISLDTISDQRTGWQAWTNEQATQAKTRYTQRTERLARESFEHDLLLEAKAQMKLADLEAHSQHTDPAVLDKKRDVIAAALERARLKRERHNPN